MILDDVFQFLNNTGLAPNHAIFSTEYLGHSARYYDYLRCSGAEPSIRCLVKVTSCLHSLAHREEIPPAHADRARLLSQSTMRAAFNRCR